MLNDLAGEAVVNDVRSEVTDPRMAVFEVVPRKEGSAEVQPDQCQV